MAVTEALERHVGPLIPFQGRDQFSGNDQLFLFFGLGPGVQSGPGLIELDCFFDIADQHFLLCWVYFVGLQARCNRNFRATREFFYERWERPASATRATTASVRFQSSGTSRVRIQRDRRPS